MPFFNRRCKNIISPGMNKFWMFPKGFICLTTFLNRSHVLDVHLKFTAHTESWKNRCFPWDIRIKTHKKGILHSFFLLSGHAQGLRWGFFFVFVFFYSSSCTVTHSVSESERDPLWPGLYRWGVYTCTEPMWFCYVFGKCTAVQW